MRVSCLAAILSTSVVFLALPGRRDTSDGGKIFKLEIEAAGFHDVETNDFAQVRDTLDHHLSLVAVHDNYLDYDWQVNGVPIDGNEGYVRTRLNLSFDSNVLRRAFMGAASIHPDLRLSLLESGMFGQFGKIDIALPVPGPDGHRLDLKAWNLHLRAWEERAAPLV